MPLSQKVKLSFSPDGKYLIIFIKKLKLFQIYEIHDNDLFGLMWRIDSGENHIKTFDEKLPNIRTLKWCPESTFLVCYGYEEMIIIDFNDDSDKQYELVEQFSIYDDDSKKDKKKKLFRAILDV